MAQLTSNQLDGVRLPGELLEISNETFRDGLGQRNKKQEIQNDFKSIETHGLEQHSGS